MTIRPLREAMNRAGFFGVPGAYVLVDGQYGSTGKGLIAGALAEAFPSSVNLVVSNAGPNSGHTSYYGEEKIVLKQLPTFAVVASKANKTSPPPVWLSGGAILDLDILFGEQRLHKVAVSVHPNAAIILPQDKIRDVTNVRSIASTGQGVGPALVNKLERGAIGTVGQWASHKNYPHPSTPHFVTNPRPAGEIVFIEVSQGFSLGINSGFYPHVTSRECTVSQALADAGLPPTAFQQSILSVRTYPIRVGDTEGSSGPHYSDQHETSWSSIGQPEEYTTVTKRVRRVFTWSRTQFMDAVEANAPSVIFLNFVNYLKPDAVAGFVNQMIDDYTLIMDKLPSAVLLGFGPKSSDIQVW